MPVAAVIMRTEGGAPVIHLAHVVKPLQLCFNWPVFYIWKQRVMQYFPDEVYQKKMNKNVVVVKENGLTYRLVD